MEAIRVMEAITLLVTLMMYSTGIVPCYEMYKSRSTKNVPFHIFLLGTVACLGMFHYGLMLDIGVLMFLNGVGAVLQAFYVLLYLLITKSKGPSLLLLLSAILYEATLYTYLHKNIQDKSARAEALGTVSSILTTVLLVLPAFEVVDNIRNKNAEGMPAVMLIGGIICSSCWIMYGIMLNDPVVYCPSIPGVLVSGTKLYMHFLYGEYHEKDE